MVEVLPSILSTTPPSSPPHTACRNCLGATLGTIMQKECTRRCRVSWEQSPPWWAECLFADPIADIAVLGMPDDQALPDEANSYNRLLASRQPLLITDAPARKCKARLLLLDGEWFECSIHRGNAWLSVEPADVVIPGISGSPIISLDGRAFGLLSTPDQNPILMDDLPRRLLSEMISAEAGDDDF